MQLFFRKKIRLGAPGARQAEGKVTAFPEAVPEGGVRLRLSDDGKGGQRRTQPRSLRLDPALLERPDRPKQCVPVVGPGERPLLLRGKKAPRKRFPIRTALLYVQPYGPVCYGAGGKPSGMREAEIQAVHVPRRLSVRSHGDLRRPREIRRGVRERKAQQQLRPDPLPPFLRIAL